MMAIMTRPAVRLRGSLDVPQDAYATAKVRKLIIYMELHIELVARQLYPEAIFGAKA